MVGYRGQPTLIVPDLKVALYDSGGTDLDVYSMPRSFLARKSPHLGVAASGLLPAGTYYVSLSAESDRYGAYMLDTLLADGKLKQGREVPGAGQRQVFRPAVRLPVAPEETQGSSRAAPARISMSNRSGTPGTWARASTSRSSRVAWTPSMTT